MNEKVPISVENHNGITVVSILIPRVNVDMSDSFEGQVVETVSSLESPKVLLDFEGVDFISSAILGKLIKLNGVVVAQRGGQFKISSLTERLSEVFKITGLDKLFSIYETRSQALKAFDQLQ